MAAPDDLRTHNDQNLRDLGTELWNWRLCQACVGRLKCGSEDCSWYRKESLNIFWESYESITDAYYPQAPEAAVLSSHNTVLAIIRAMTSHPEWTRNDLITHHVPNDDAQLNRTLVEMDQLRAINIVASLVFLIDCGHKRSYKNQTPPYRWRHNVKVCDVIKEAFPQSMMVPIADSGNTLVKQDPQAVFSAASLKKRIAGLRFEATTDLRCHFRFDRRTRLLQFFQATAVLRQTLLASKPCLVPKPLALEVCDTIYNVLIHVNDTAS